MAATLSVSTTADAAGRRLHVTNFPIDACSPFRGGLVLTAGPTKEVSFTCAANQSGSLLGRITANGAVQTFPYPRDIGSSTADATGNIWFTSPVQPTTDPSAPIPAVGVLAPTGAISTYPLPLATSALGGIATGPDGNIWALEFGLSSDFSNDRIDRVSPSGAISAFPTPYFAGSLAAGNGRLWANAGGGGVAPAGLAGIDRSGTVTVHRLPGQTFIGRLFADRAGARTWAVLYGGSRAKGPQDGDVAQVNNDGTIRRYPTTILASTPGRPFGIQRPSYGPVVASDNRGRLWFVSTLDKRLLRRVGPSGKAVTQYTVPRFAGPPTNAVFGPDGNLWIALDGPNKWILARVSLR